jgi:hypothetical protein
VATKLPSERDPLQLPEELDKDVGSGCDGTIIPYRPCMRRVAEDPDPTARVVNITTEARDHMNMRMGDRLPGRLTIVDADGETLRLQLVDQ